MSRIVSCPICMKPVVYPEDEILAGNNVTIVCPNCGNKITIDHKPVSDDILDKLRRFLGE